MSTKISQAVRSACYGTPKDTQNGDDPTTLLIRVWLLRVLERMPLTNSVKESSRVCKLLVTYLPEFNHDELKQPQSIKGITTVLAKAEDKLCMNRQRHLPMWQNQAFIMSKLGATKCEAEVFLFLCMINQFNDLEHLSKFAGERFNMRQLPEFLSTVLQYPAKDIAYALSSGSTLIAAKIVETSIFAHAPLDNFEIRQDIANKFLTELLTVDNLLGTMVTETPKSSLTTADFDHIHQQLSLLQRYLKSAIKERSYGVNILIHGLPGTGKTEFSYLLAELVKSKLFAVATHDHKGNAHQGRERLNMLELANKAMKNRACILLFDEAEDAFSSTPFEQSAAARSKAWTNKLLETNALPTIWVSNDIRCIDNAMIRRFDLVIEFKPLSPQQREVSFAKVVRPNTSKALLKVLAQHKRLQIAIVARAHKVADRVHPRSQKQYETLLLNVINATLKAQRLRPVSLQAITHKGDNFDLRLVNTSMDLGQVCAGVKKHANVRICLYGAPGTGKTLFAHYLGKRLKRPVLEVHGSDILSKYVGENEQKLAEVFARAKAMNAILVMDEIDTFLPSRTEVGGQWQSNLVNEMLVQLENFEGTFLASTNLIEQLDEAALRRFDIKLEFKSLGKAQIEQLITELCQDLIPNFAAEELPEIVKAAQHIEGLTPGDGLVIKRQARFQSIVDGTDLLARLQHEVALKPSVSSKGRIGF